MVLCHCTASRPARRINGISLVFPQCLCRGLVIFIGRLVLYILPTLPSYSGRVLHLTSLLTNSVLGSYAMCAKLLLFVRQ